MDKKSILIPLAIVIVLLVGARVFLSQGSEGEVPPNNITRSAEVVGDEAGETQTFTEEEVASKNSRTECWTIIAGVVYDITDYIDYHPGGDTILLACGKDSTELFLNRRNEDGEPVGSGRPHSETAQQMLYEFEIGELAR
jgi:cytochrome b involved in lipid metabolism